MSSAAEGRPDDEALLKQYEMAWQQIYHLDSSFIQMTLLYIAIIGAYIGNIEDFAGSPPLIAGCVALVGICMVGIIWRLRRMIDHLFDIVTDIEERTAMAVRKPINGLGAVRTSTYLLLIVTIMTGLAVFLTLATGTPEATVVEQGR
jgi:hypothetical protein